MSTVLIIGASKGIGMTLLLGALAWANHLDATTHEARSRQIGGIR